MEKQFYVYYSEKNLNYLSKINLSPKDNIYKTCYKHTQVKNLSIKKISDTEYLCTYLGSIYWKKLRQTSITGRWIT